MAVLYWQLQASGTFRFSVSVVPAVNLTKNVPGNTFGFIKHTILEFQGMQADRFSVSALLIRAQCIRHTNMATVTRAVTSNAIGSISSIVYKRN